MNKIPRGESALSEIPIVTQRTRQYALFASRWALLELQKTSQRGG